jgi:hypothetical protein
MDFGGDVDHVIGVAIDECLEDIEDSVSMAGDKGIGVIAEGNGKPSLSFWGLKDTIEELVEDVGFWGEGGEFFRLGWPAQWAHDSSAYPEMPDRIGINTVAPIRDCSGSYS